MSEKTILCAGSTPAIRYAKQFLRTKGFSIAEDASWDVGHLLLDIPSFQDPHTLRTGGKIDTLLESLPKNILIWGGKLESDSLEKYKTIDLLTDEAYLAQNAAITADCAVKIVSPLLKATWQDSPVLVIGWGRIGKCLAKLLKAMGNDVTVASRSIASRAALQSLGYHTVDTAQITEHCNTYRIVFNTVPFPVITEETASNWNHCIKIDLASAKGIAGDDVVWARGLPGTHAPESSGRLIADTISRIWKERTP